MDRPVTVGVTGTHSTGKSTFLARLARELRLRDVEVATVADLGEKAKKMGLPILFNHTWASTLWIVTRGISEELEAWLHADAVLVDRPVPDALGYYHAALEHRGQRPQPNELAQLEALVREHSRRYDLVLRTTLDPSVPMGDGKERDDNARFRRLADHHIARVLDELNLPYEPLPADGHDQALQRAVDLVLRRLVRQPQFAVWAMFAGHGVVGCGGGTSVRGLGGVVATRSSAGDGFWVGVGG